jgi:hypothetical protein
MTSSLVRYLSLLRPFEATTESVGSAAASACQLTANSADRTEQTGHNNRQHQSFELDPSVGTDNPP